MLPNPQEIAGLVIFTEKIPNGKLLFCVLWMVLKKLEESFKKI